MEFQLHPASRSGAVRCCPVVRARRALGDRGRRRRSRRCACRSGSRCRSWPAAGPAPSRNPGRAFSCPWPGRSNASGRCGTAEIRARALEAADQLNRIAFLYGVPLARWPQSLSPEMGLLASDDPVRFAQGCERYLAALERGRVLLDGRRDRRIRGLAAPDAVAPSRPKRARRALRAVRAAGLSLDARRGVLSGHRPGRSRGFRGDRPGGGRRRLRRAPQGAGRVSASDPLRKSGRPPARRARGPRCTATSSRSRSGAGERVVRGPAARHRRNHGLGRVARTALRVLAAEPAADSPRPIRNSRFWIGGWVGAKRPWRRCGDVGGRHRRASARTLEF